jgi:HK97 family phage portal protein
MGIFSRLFGRAEERNIKASDPYLAEYFGMGSGLTGGVDAQRASGLATAGACIGVVSQSLASVPLCAYRRTRNGGRERAPDHPLYSVLHDQPNGQQTSFELREALIASLMIAGNAYAAIDWNARGQVIGLRLIDPAAVSVERLPSGRLRYRVARRNGGTDLMLQEEVLHLRYRLARDGVMGLSPIRIARETFGLALAQQDTATGLALKGNRPSGALVFPTALSDAVKERGLTRLREKIEADTVTSGVLILDGGVQWQSLSMTPLDAQFLESRKLTNLDICRVFGVPPTAVGILDNSTYNNLEQESRALVVRCLAPMARRVEQAMNSALLSESARKTFFVEHDLAGLMRGDIKARYEAYRHGRQWGWLSPNEIRGLENLPEIEGGDEYLSPLNMVPLDQRDSAGIRDVEQGG